MSFLNEGVVTLNLVVCFSILLIKSGAHLCSVINLERCHTRSAIMISISLGNESLTHRKKGDNISSRSGSPQYGNFYLPLLTFHLHIITEIWV